MRYAHLSGLPQTVDTLVDVARHNARACGDRQYVLWLENGRVESGAYTFAELDRQARAMAVHMRNVLNADASGRGEREQDAALIVVQPGLPFVVGFFACLYAGIAPVPTYAVRDSRGTERLCAIVDDAGARLVLSDRSTHDILADCPALSSRAVLLEIGTAPESCAESWEMPVIGADTVALIQYTSGSTGSPRGVVVTHANLMANERMIGAAMGNDANSVYVSWLPLFHDMGLIGNLLHTMYLGARCVLMSPMAFIANPIRWLEAISRYRASNSGAPNFAYDLCLARTTPEQRATLDLSCWRVAYNGAEPVRARTLDAFANAFAVSGFRREALFPCYGMAEATLMVSGAHLHAAPTVIQADKAQLARDRIELVASSALATPVALVSSGIAALDTTVRIVDPESMTALPEGRVGEIWVNGPGVPIAYRNQTELSEATFHARIVDEGDMPFLRTGDLGFLHEGELFVTGRLKDLIIISGSNHYPHDIEATALAAHAELAAAAAVAFSVEAQGEERLVIVLAIGKRQRPEQALLEMAAAVRRAVRGHHGVPVYDLVLTRARVPTTSSGKVQRRKARQIYLDGDFDVISAALASAPQLATSE